jgi:hypothetical protein
MTAVAEHVASPRVKDAEYLSVFVSIWCQDHHGHLPREPWKPKGILGELLPEDGPVLCRDCVKLLGYSLGRRLLCPYEPKPACKSCETPCYRDEHRATMREVMKYSGLRLILRGRIDVFLKYFF